MFTFKFPDIGEGIHEGTILKWHVKVGDKVAEGDLLVVVETDKVNAELTSPEAGTIKELGPKEGGIIHVGDTVALIDNASGGNEAPEKTESIKETKEEKPKESGAGVVGEIVVSDEIIGSYQAEVKPTSTRVLASPVARKIASDRSIDLSQVSGTGEQGRILKSDLENLTRKPVAQASSFIAPEVKKPNGEFEVIKISRLRKAISNAMTTSKTLVPHTVLMDEIIVDDLVDFRTKAKAYAADRGVKLTYLTFISKAVIIALKEFPIFNASFNHDTDEVYIKKFINLGIAVDTKDGLIVPNVKNADQLTMLDLARTIDDLATRTNARKITLEEQQNGTFTITNFGSVGISHGTPVIYYPELAILGIGKISLKPVVKNGKIEIASVLPLSLAVDHRIIDGAEGGRFLLRIKQLLENPTTLMLE